MNAKQKVGLLVATLVGINAMLGAGVLTIPNFFATEVGPAGIISYLISIVFVLCMVISLGYLAILSPGKGWSYYYPSLWGGKKLGLFASLSYALGVLIAMGFLTQQSGVWLSDIIDFMPPKVISILVLFFISLLVLGGTRISSIGQYLLVGCAFAAILTVTGIGFAHFNPKLMIPFTPEGTASIFSAAPKALFSLLGFESIISLYSIMKNPKKNIFRAGVIAVLAVGTLYILFTSSVLFSIEKEYFLEQANISLASVLIEKFPTLTYATWFIYFGGLFAILGTIHSMVWSLSTLIGDVVQYVDHPSIAKFLKVSEHKSKKIIIFNALIILLITLTLESEAILLLTVIFVTTPMILSFFYLLLQKKQWSTGRNLITSVGTIGGIFLIAFAIKDLIF